MSILDDKEIRVLDEALDDEYRARATYDQVIADHGEVPPFSNIRQAEARHVEALCALFARYGLPRLVDDLRKLLKQQQETPCNERFW